MNKQDTQTQFEACCFMHAKPQEQQVKQDQVCLLCELTICTQAEPHTGCTNSMLNKDYMDIYAEEPRRK